MVTDKEIEEAFDKIFHRPSEMEIVLAVMNHEESLVTKYLGQSDGFIAGAKWMQGKMKEEKHKPWYATPNTCVVCGLNITTNGTDKSCGCDK